MPVVGNGMVEALGRKWHPEHLTCTECSKVGGLYPCSKVGGLYPCYFFSDYSVRIEYYLCLCPHVALTEYKAYI